MPLSKISLRNFRCFESLELSLSPGVNFFYGSNGSGKTSLLESIYLFSVLDGKKVSKPNSVNFMFSLISTEVRFAVNLKALALKEPFITLAGVVKLELSCDVCTCKFDVKRSLPSPSKLPLKSKSGIESKSSDTKKPSVLRCLTILMF